MNFLFAFTFLLAFSAKAASGSEVIECIFPNDEIAKSAGDFKVLIYPEKNEMLLLSQTLKQSVSLHIDRHYTRGGLANGVIDAYETSVIYKGLDVVHELFIFPDGEAKLVYYEKNNPNDFIKWFMHCENI